MRSKITDAVEVNQMVGRICKPDFCFPTYVEDPASEFLSGSEHTYKDFWKRASGGELLKSEVAQLRDGIGGVDRLNQEEPLVLRIQHDNIGKHVVLIFGSVDIVLGEVDR